MCMFLHPLFILIPQYNPAYSYPCSSLCMCFCSFERNYSDIRQCIHLYTRCIQCNNHQNNFQSNFQSNYLYMWCCKCLRIHRYTLSYSCQYMYPDTHQYRSCYTLSYIGLRTYRCKRWNNHYQRLHS